MSLWNIFTTPGQETAVATRSAQEPFLDLQTLVNRSFDDFLTPFASRWSPPWGEPFPRVDLVDTVEELQVTAELPGVRVSS